MTFELFLSRGISSSTRNVQRASSKSATICVSGFRAIGYDILPFTEAEALEAPLTFRTDPVVIIDREAVSRWRDHCLRVRVRNGMAESAVADVPRPLSHLRPVAAHVTANPRTGFLGLRKPAPLRLARRGARTRRFGLYRRA